jgi:hypothetical protein
MARGPVGRKIARAARTGGSRTRRRQTPFGYYITLVIVVLLGLATVGFSRYQAHHPASAVPPTIHDHWHAAFAFDICGKLQPNPKPNPNASQVGINTLGQGIINIQPLAGQPDTGPNATLGRFVKDYPGMELTSSTLRYPGQRAWHDGDLCGAKPGQVQVKVWNSLASSTGHIVSDPASLLLENGQLITIAFVPSGTAVPKPPSAANLLNASTTASLPATTSTTSHKSTSSHKSRTTHRSTTTHGAQAKPTSTTKP